LAFVSDRPLDTATEALARLVAGNERFVRGQARFPTVQKEILVANLFTGAFWFTWPIRRTRHGQAK
jgi:hypothetical protein